VGQNAEAIKGGCFGPKDDGTEGDGLASAALGQGEFGRCEVAFRAHQNANTARRRVVGEDILDPAGVGLERGNEHQFAGLVVLKKVPRRLGKSNFREAILTALLAGFDGDFAPFVSFFGCIGPGDLDHGAVGKEGRDPGGSEFNRLLNDEVHVFTLGYGLGQGDGTGQRRRGGFLANSQKHGLAFQGADLRGGFGAFAVEDDNTIIWFQSEDIEGVMGFGGIQSGGGGVPRGGWEIKSIHEEVISGKKSQGIGVGRGLSDPAVSDFPLRPWRPLREVCFF